MPLYPYECTECGKRFDIVRKVERRNEPASCIVCESPAERVVCAPMVATSFNAYRTVAHDKETGKTMLIKNRDEHAAFLRRNGYEEVGNDSSMKLPSDEERAKRRAEQQRDAETPIVFDFDPDTQEAKL